MSRFREMHARITKRQGKQGQYEGGNERRDPNNACATDRVNRILSHLLGTTPICQNSQDIGAQPCSLHRIVHVAACT